MIRKLLRYFSVLLLYFFAFFVASGQDDLKKNRLGLHAGIGFLSRQDLIFSPLIHKDLSVINTGLEFTREHRIFQDISLRFSSFSPIASDSYEYYDDGELKTAAPHSFILVRLTYLAGKTWEAGPTDLTAGLMLNADIQALNYAYGRISSFGYYAALSPGGFVKFSRKLGEKGRLSAILKVPVVTLYARSPYLVNDDEYIENISSHSAVRTFIAFLDDGRWVTWNRLQHFNAEIRYDYNLSPRWGIGSAWIFDFIHAAAPRKLLSFENSILLSAYFRF